MIKKNDEEEEKEEEEEKKEKNLLTWGLFAKAGPCWVG